MHDLLQNIKLITAEKLSIRTDIPNLEIILSPLQSLQKSLPHLQKNTYKS